MRVSGSSAIPATLLVTDRRMTYKAPGGYFGHSVKVQLQVNLLIARSSVGSVHRIGDA